MSMQLAERKKLIGFIAEIEASRDRAKGETRHQSEIFKEAKEVGFDNKAMRKVLQRRAMSQVDREKMDEAIDAYEHALGALANAREAIAAGMSAREASEKYLVPRGALGIVARIPDGGAENAIVEPDGPGSVAVTNSESCGPCPVSAADGAAKGNGLPSAKGKAEHESPATRRHTSDDALASALGTTRCEDRASPGPQDPIEAGTHQEEGEGESCGPGPYRRCPAEAIGLSGNSPPQPDGCSTGEATEEYVARCAPHLDERADTATQLPPEHPCCWGDGEVHSSWCPVHGSEKPIEPTPPLGAVAEPEAQRVARPTDDGLDIPDFLDRRREIKSRRATT